jgi:excinuclease ABC subunit C
VIKGAIVQSHNVEIRQGLDESEEELLGFAIAEIRNRMTSISKEILVPFVPEFKLEGCKYTKPSRGDKKKLLELSLRNAKAFANEKMRDAEKADPKSRETRILNTLKKDLKLNSLPVHIECFDNSNLQGTNAVAACVVFRNGKPSKREYRHFNIKTVVGPDDFASMKEVVSRRYRRLIEENEALPQLIVIDGGKGQLSSAYSALKELRIEQEVKVIGIAKRLEEIFSPTDTVPLYLDKSSESLKVIQHIRNEAHRFGIKHHRGKREKEVKTSALLIIPGIGEKTIQKLFKEYKNIQSIEKKSEEELAQIIGKSKAKIVYNHFRKDNLKTKNVNQ